MCPNCLNLWKRISFVMSRAIVSYMQTSKTLEDSECELWEFLESDLVYNIMRV